jgi:NADP-dependent 3-hydroxy acid dehydrogenase YdfG
MIKKSLLKKQITFLFYTLVIWTSTVHASYNKNMPKVVVITGTSQGIGLATTAYLAQQGYNVCAGVRKTSSRTEIDRLAQKFPTQVLVIELDVTDQATIAAGCKLILDRFGHIDVLVNNACEILLGAMETQTIEEQQRVMDVNYFGVVRMIQAIAPIMRSQEGGTIINISSIAGIEPFPNVETYVASKYALEGLSESLATTLAPWNIKVSIIEPGVVRTQGPANMRLGSCASTDTECFSEYNKQVLAFMHNRLGAVAGAPGFSEPLEVAQCVESIITSEKPHVRYQIGEIAKNIAAARFKDTTGDSYVETRKKQFTERGFMIRSTSPKKNSLAYPFQEINH